MDGPFARGQPIQTSSSDDEDGNHVSSIDTKSPSPDRVQEYFVQLKPICISILDPSFWTKPFQQDQNPLYQLSIKLASIPPEIITKLFHYISFPLLHILQHPSALDRNRELALDNLWRLLCNTDIDKIPQSLFLEIITALPLILANGYIDRRKQISQSQQQVSDTSSKVPEEIQLLAVKCLERLSSHTDTPVISESYLWNKDPFQPLVAHIIYELLTIIKSLQHQLLELVVISLRTVNLIIDRVQEAEILATSMPGILTGVAAVFGKDVKGHHQVIVAALDVVTNVLSRVLGDGVCANVMEENDEMKSNEGASKLPPTRTRFTKQWLSTTQKNIYNLLQKVFTTRTHASPHVRLALAKQSRVMISSCGKFGLPKMVPVALDTLLLGLVDPDANVIAFTQSTLKELLQQDSDNRLLDIAKTRFCELMMLVPHQIATINARIVSHTTSSFNPVGAKEMLDLLTGYVNFLRDEISVMFAVSDLLEKFFTPLLDRVVCSIDESMVEMGHGNFRRRFKTIDDEDTVVSLQNLLRALARFGGVSVFDFVAEKVFARDVVVDDPRTREGMLWVMNEMCWSLESSDSSNDADYNNTVRGLLRLYISYPGFSYDVIAQPTPNTNLIALLIDGIGILSTRLSPSITELTLIDTLYLILSQRSSSSYVVQTQSNTCLDRIAKHLSQPNGTKSLVESNLDYILNSTATRLARAKLVGVEDCRLDDVYSVLAAVLNILGERVIPVLEDVVLEIIDLCRGGDAYSVKVLEQVVQCLCQDGDNVMVKPRVKGLDDDLDELREWLDKSLNAKDKDALEMENAEEIEANNTTNDESILTFEQRITHDIVSILPYHLTDSSPIIRIHVLKAISSSAPILAATNKFLPFVHQIWPNLVKRFNDAEHGVVLEAQVTLRALLRYAKDFVAKRLVDVLPLLAKLIKPFTENEFQSPVPASKKLQDGLYLSSFVYKLQLATLNTYASILEFGGLKYRDAWGIVDQVLPYLQDAIVVPALVNAAKECLMIAASCTNIGDKLWMALQAKTDNSLFEKNGFGKVTIPLPLVKGFLKHGKLKSSLVFI